MMIHLPLIGKPVVSQIANDLAQVAESSRLSLDGLGNGLQAGDGTPAVGYDERLSRFLQVFQKSNATRFELCNPNRLHDQIIDLVTSRGQFSTRQAS
jgi:hypothetical protein